MPRRFAVSVLLVFLSSLGLVLAWHVPDTGQTRKFLLNQFGEDSDYTIHPPSYTKLDASGGELPDAAADWAVVRDNVTGLVWENKTDDPYDVDIQDVDRVFTWNPGTAGDGGDHPPTYGVDNLLDSLNASHFGGFSDWRLPTLKELSSIIDNGDYVPELDNPAINAAYFPHTATSSSGYRYWTSTTTYYGNLAFAVDFRDGLNGTDPTDNRNFVRAVRGGRPANPNHFIDSTPPNQSAPEYNVITDTSTGLMWQKQGPLWYDGAPMAWTAAVAYCESYGLSVQRPDGNWPYYQDWRLPTWKELQSIAEYGRQYAPAIDTEFFLGVFTTTNSQRSGGFYWSSTHDARNRGALALHFAGGSLEIRGETQTAYVRCVRGGQRGPAGDSDGDGIYDDGDDSGSAGDNYCTGTDQVLCDDNCPSIPNPDQADRNGNGIGDACDASDSTPPVIVAAIAGTPGNDGWYTSDVTVNWTVTDLESEAVIDSGCGTQAFTLDTASQLSTCTAHSSGGSASNSVTLKIDKTPPIVACSVTPNILWPANHKLVQVNASLSVSDSASGQAGFRLLSVTSSEPDNGLGDGDTVDDIQGFVVGTASRRGSLRAERSGLGAGRIYLLAYEGVDTAGNAATCRATVTVPHDQRKK